RRHFPGTVTPFEGFPFAIHTGRISLTPFFERLPKRLCRDNMFPFNALGSIRVFLRLIPTTRRIDLVPSVDTAAVEFGLMSDKDLCHKLLGFIEGFDTGILGKERRGRGE